MPVLKSHSRTASFIPDDRQRQAIEHVHGPLLVIAGAGTGKTSVLTHRVARLVREGHARTDEILALTYTRNAAAELKARVCALLDDKQVQAATFHDFCFDLLKREGKDFRVLDDQDLWVYLRRRIRELRLEYFVRAANVGQFLTDLLDFVKRCHDELVTPDKYAAYVERLERREIPIPRVAKSKQLLSESEVLGRCREIARVFATLERWLQEENFGTFSHMITRAHTLLENDEKALAQARDRARFISVDEFQDANFAQIRILSRLVGAEENLFVVGDPDQAIYRFRGASSAAFEIFRHHFPCARLVVLDKNRRSTAPILQCAFPLIDKNPPVFAQNRGQGHSNSGSGFSYRRTPLQSAREEESLRAGNPLPSSPVTLTCYAGKDAEGPDVVSIIRELRGKQRCKWSDFAVLYRTHVHRDDVVRELAEAEIPFTIEAMDISDTPPVRDLFACLSAVVSEGDDVSLFRVVALPQFNVDPEQLRSALRSLDRDSRSGNVATLASALDRVPGGSAVIESIRAAREEINRRQAKGRGALEIIARQFHLDTHSEVVQAALKFVSDWETKAINQTGELSELVEYLPLFREAGGVIALASEGHENAVRLMTVHLAKGLEFPHVFILRANAASFPSGFHETLVEFPNDLRDPDSAAEGDDRTLHSQEERRLFYVAMTRARDSLHIYAKQGTGKDKTPAGLMRELLRDVAPRPCLRTRSTCGAQTELDIFAGASETQPFVSRTQQWLELPATPGLHARLSASAVDTYERCPLQFKLQRDWRMPATPAAAMQYGAAMHRVLRTYYDSVSAGRPKSDDELIELFRQDLAAERIQEQYQHELYEKQGVEQLKDFLTAARSAPAPDVLHTEQGFEIRFGDTVVLGRMDRIDRNADGGVTIIDYKTGKARDQEDADESLQLSIYALAARDKWGYRVDSLVFYNLEENVPVITARSDVQLCEARDRVEAAAQNIAAGRFPAKADFHCSFCPYRSLCPAKEKRVPGLVVSSPTKQSS